MGILCHYPVLYWTILELNGGPQDIHDKDPEYAWMVMSIEPRTIGLAGHWMDTGWTLASSLNPRGLTTQAPMLH